MKREQRQTISRNYVAALPRECNFPYPISKDGICRNGMEDNGDGKEDQTFYCTESPGVTKARPSRWHINTNSSISIVGASPSMMVCLATQEMILALQYLIRDLFMARALYPFFANFTFFL